MRHVKRFRLMELGMMLTRTWVEVCNTCAKVLQRQSRQCSVCRWLCSTRVGQISPYAQHAGMVPAGAGGRTGTGWRRR